MAKGGGRRVQPLGVTSVVSVAREAHLRGLCPVCALSLIPTGVCPHPSPDLFLLDRAGHRIACHVPPELMGLLSLNNSAWSGHVHRGLLLCRNFPEHKSTCGRSLSSPSIRPGLRMVLGPQPANNDRMLADGPADGRSSG